MVLCEFRAACCGTRLFFMDLHLNAGISSLTEGNVMSYEVLISLKMSAGLKETLRRFSWICQKNRTAWATTGGVFHIDAPCLDPPPTGSLHKCYILNQGDQTWYMWASIQPGSLSFFTKESGITGKGAAGWIVVFKGLDLDKPVLVYIYSPLLR